MSILVSSFNSVAIVKRKEQTCCLRLVVWPMAYSKKLGCFSHYIFYKLYPVHVKDTDNILLIYSLLLRKGIYLFHIQGSQNWSLVSLPIILSASVSSKQQTCIFYKSFLNKMLLLFKLYLQLCHLDTYLPDSSYVHFFV